MRCSAESILAISLRWRSRARSSIARSVSEEARSARSKWFSFSACRWASVSLASLRISSRQASSFRLKYSRWRSFINGSLSVGLYGLFLSRMLAPLLCAGIATPFDRHEPPVGGRAYIGRRGARQYLRGDTKRCAAKKSAPRRAPGHTAAAGSGRRVRHEFQRHAVDAVAQARGRRAVLEHVAQMPAAAPAVHLGAQHEEAAIRGGADRVR